MNIVIKKPVFSEKSMQMAKSGFYTFLVNRDARKPLIKKAIADKFNVDVISVKTINIKDEIKSQKRSRNYYTVAGFKKAIVSLKKGQRINIFETEEQKSSSSEASEDKEVKVKEKKSLLKGTKVKIEKGEKGK